MKNIKKTIFYEVNPKYFKDQNGDGIGDLKGLIAIFEYFNHLGIETLIMQEVLAIDAKNSQSSATEIDPKIGNVKDMKKLIALAKKYKIQIVFELNIGTITKNNKLFKTSNEKKDSEYYKVVDFKLEKEKENLEYAYSEDNKKYYLYDSKTKEIPLNWESNATLNNFLKIIKFWRNIGIDGFVIEKFEYLCDESKTESLNAKTMNELKNFYKFVKKIDEQIILIGRSNIVKINDASLYTNEPNKLFDFFMSSNISMIGISNKHGKDVPGFFIPKMYAFFVKNYIKNNKNILSLNSKEVGKVISRWANDGEYIQKSAKALAILLMFNNASSSIYYGDEIGLPNLGLTNENNFQTPDFQERKNAAIKKKISEKRFFKAQIKNNPINARALMIWSDDKNGGFSKADDTITPVLHSFKEINVKNQYKNQNSILNFYRQLIKITTSSSFSKIISDGQIKANFFLPGIIKYKISLNKKELDVIVNLTNANKLNIYTKKAGKIICSSYNNKVYKNIPKILEPFEAIVISRSTLEYIKTTQQIKIEKLKHAEKEEKEKIKATDLANKENEKNKLKNKKLKEREIEERIKKAQEEEKLELIKMSKKRSESIDKITKHVTEKKSFKNNDNDAGEELEEFKKAVIIDWESEKSHLEDATKLKEEEVAKTTLIDDQIDVEDLFDLDKKK